MKSCYTFERFDDPEKLYKFQYPPQETFFSKLRKVNPLEKDYSNFQWLIDGGLASEEALSKLNMKQPPATGQKNYQNMISVWQQENLSTIKDFLRWYTTRTTFLS